MKRVSALITAIACLTALPAFAQDEEGSGGEPDYGRIGWYIGLQGIYAQSAFRDQGQGDWGGSPGMNGRVGYRASDSFAIEGEIEWIHEFSNDSDNRTARTILGTINGKFFFSSGRVQPYAIVGAGAMNVTIEGDFGSNSGTDWGFRFGAGIDLYTTEDISIGLEARYNWGVGDVWELDSATFGAGMQYRF